MLYNMRCIRVLAVRYHAVHSKCHAVVQRNFWTKEMNVEHKLFDFTTPSSFNKTDADNWKEVSDTVRTPGMSKAIFCLQRTQLFQRGIMFAMINPQPNGAGFAGMTTNMPQHVPADVKGFHLHVRRQGVLKYWKVSLKLNSVQYEYESKFALKENQFEDIFLPLSDFVALFRGAVVPDAPPLDITSIDGIGLQTFGGVYDEFKQAGTGSLEIDFISLYS